MTEWNLGRISDVDAFAAAEIATEKVQRRKMLLSIVQCSTMQLFLQSHSRVCRLGVRPPVFCIYAATFRRGNFGSARHLVQATLPSKDQVISRIYGQGSSWGKFKSPMRGPTKMRRWIFEIRFFTAIVQNYCVGTEEPKLTSLRMYAARLESDTVLTAICDAVVVEMRGSWRTLDGRIHLGKT